MGGLKRRLFFSKTIFYFLNCSFCLKIFNNPQIRFGAKISFIGSITHIVPQNPMKSVSSPNVCVNCVLNLETRKRSGFSIFLL